MKNTKGFFYGLAASIFFVIGAALMIFSNTLLGGQILLVIGFLTTLAALGRTKHLSFEDNFLFIASILGLIIIAYTAYLAYSKNLIIISTSFFALNFLLQVNKTKKKQKTKKQKTLKKKIKEFKEEIKPKKQYFYTETGKSFHLLGCISLTRTKPEKIKKSPSRNYLISKGYKTCKTCNS